MSIILKGIDMPKSCGGCEFNYWLEGGSYEWWECVILHDDINQFDTRRTDCPLVEIPTPHGRIIDEKELKDLYSQMPFNDNEIRFSKNDIYCNLWNIKTILEAEE